MSHRARLLGASPTLPCASRCMHKAFSQVYLSDSRVKIPTPLADVGSNTFHVQAFPHHVLHKKKKKKKTLSLAPARPNFHRVSGFITRQ